MTGTPRATHVLHFATLADLVAGYAVAVPHVLLIAGDLSGASHDELDAAAGAMLRAGAQYTCCWGDGCEVLEDMIDDYIVVHGLETGDVGDVIFTTSHAQETLDEAIWFAHACAAAAPARPRAESTVIACIGPPTLAERAHAIVNALARPSRRLP